MGKPAELSGGWASTSFRSFRSGEIGGPWKDGITCVWVNETTTSTNDLTILDMVNDRDRCGECKVNYPLLWPNISVLFFRWNLFTETWKKHMGSGNQGNQGNLKISGIFWTEQLGVPFWQSIDTLNFIKMTLWFQADEIGSVLRETINCHCEIRAFHENVRHVKDSRPESNHRHWDYHMFFCFFSKATLVGGLEHDFDFPIYWE